MRKLLVFVFAFAGLYTYSQSICGGSSTTLQATNPQNLTGPSYSLNPGGFQSGSGSFVVSPPSTTTYTLYTTGQNTNAAVVTTTVVTTVTVTAQPNTNPTYTQATCASSVNAINLGLTFSPATPAPGYTIAWSPIPTSVTSAQQTTATGLSAGPYTVQIVAAGGCSTTLLFTMTPQPAPANFSVIPFGGTQSITCIQPTIEMSATNANLTYTWNGASFPPVVSPSLTVDDQSLGTVTITGLNPVSNCTTTYTLLIAQNVSVPTSTLSTNNINITCTQTLAPTLTITASPTVNVTNYVYSPQGGTFAASTQPSIYYPGGPGIFTCTTINDANGCSVTKTFTVNTNDNYPVFDVTSPVSNFTLGCTTKSVATIVIENAATTPTPGGAVSYTIIGPPTSTTIPGGSLSGSTTWTINTPGTWTVIVKDNTNNCLTRNQISILQNTFAPLLSASVPLQILDCDNPSTVLLAQSETPNVGYNWGFQGTPGNVQSSTIAVNANTVASTQTLINTYTLTVTDLSSTCRSTSIIPMYQNVYRPNTAISAQANTALTCLTNTVVLTNQSSTGIPANSPFPRNLFVIGYLWTGPTPQEPLQLSTTYVGGVAGVYTLTGKDLNNGCFSTGTFTVSDNRVFPVIATQTNPYTLDCGEDFVLIQPTVVGTSFTYSWTTPPGASPSQTINPGKDIRVSSAGIYTVVVTNTVNGCKTQTVASVVTGSLTADFSINPVRGFAPLTVDFTNNSFSSTGSVGINSAWSYGNGTQSGTTTPTGSFVPGFISNTVSPQVVYNQPGTYTVAMFAVKGACTDTMYRTVQVELPSSLEVPNVFTPNNDGVNDLFFLKATNLIEINMTIFDRWGQTVYELISTTGNVAWDGKNGQGNDAAEGTYFYVLKAIGDDGTEYDQKGTISLYR